MTAAAAVVVCCICICICSLTAAAAAVVCCICICFFVFAVSQQQQQQQWCAVRGKSADTNTVLAPAPSYSKLFLGRRTFQYDSFPTKQDCSLALLAPYSKLALQNRTLFLQSKTVHWLCQHPLNFSYRDFVKVGLFPIKTLNSTSYPLAVMEPAASSIEKHAKCHLGGHHFLFLLPHKATTEGWYQN